MALGEAHTVCEVRTLSDPARNNRSAQRSPMHPKLTLCVLRVAAQENRLRLGSILVPGRGLQEEQPDEGWTAVAVRGYRRD